MVYCNMKYNVLLYEIFREKSREIRARFVEGKEEKASNNIKKLKIVYCNKKYNIKRFIAKNRENKREKGK